MNLGSCNFGLKSYLWFQIELTLRTHSILKSCIWFQTKLHSTQFSYHYETYWLHKSNNNSFSRDKNRSLKIIWRPVKMDVFKSHSITCCCQFSLEVIVGFFFSGTSLARIGGFSKNWGSNQKACKIKKIGTGMLLSLCHFVFFPIHVPQFEQQNFSRAMCRLCCLNCQEQHLK